MLVLSLPVPCRGETAETLACSGDLLHWPCLYPPPSAPVSRPSLLPPSFPLHLALTLLGAGMPPTKTGGPPHLGPAPAPTVTATWYGPQTPHRESSLWVRLLLGPGGFLLSFCSLLALQEEASSPGTHLPLPPPSSEAPPHHPDTQESPLCVWATQPHSANICTI